MDDIDEIAPIAEANPWLAWLAVAIAVAASILLALVVAFVFSRVMAGLGRKHNVFVELGHRFPKVIFWVIAVIGVWATAPRMMPEDFAELAAIVEYLLRLAMIAVIGWLLAKILIFFVDGALRAQRKIDDPFTLRQRTTQIRMIRRLVIVVVLVLTAGAMLLTIPGAQAFGASLLASAGVASIVAGIAAQSTLGNLIAGLQLAFSNALRTGDTVEVNGEYGTVEEITLTYVVVQIWDDRRLVLPSIWFTTTPYTNWTRNQTAVTGTVYLEVDYTIDVDAVRDELQMVLDGTDLWDRRSWSLVMTDAVGGVAQLRASLTAADADDIWSLRCLVREKLVAFIARKRPDEMVRRREIVETPAPRSSGGFDLPTATDGISTQAEGDA